MKKVLTRFVSPHFSIEEATLILVNPARISLDLATASEALYTVPVRSGVAEISVEKPGELQGWLADIVFQRTTNGTVRQSKLCIFSQHITDSALTFGELSVDLSSYKEVVLRLHGKDIASRFKVFCLALEASEPSFDIPIDHSGETALLLASGGYRVRAGGTSRSALIHFRIGPDDAAVKVVDIDGNNHSI